MTRGVEWFIPQGTTEQYGIRQRMSVYILAHFAGILLSLIMALALYRALPSAGQSLLLLAILYVSIGALPAWLKLLPRLEVMATISSQLFMFAVLVSAYLFGGLVSPAIPWLFPAIGTTLYYLAPWPRLRNANIAVQFVQIAVFILFHDHRGIGAEQISSDTLIGVTIVSSLAVSGLISFAAFQIWASTLAKQRQLELEIAERKSVEAELRDSRDHLAISQRIGKIGSAEITYNDDGTTDTRWSAGMFELLGISAASDRAPNTAEFLEFVHPDDREDVIARRQREARGGALRPSEFRVIRSDKAVRWLRRVAAPINQDSYRRKPVVLLFTDITDQREAEEALAKLEQMLVQAQKMEAIGKLSGGLAHDFNNLLGVMLGMLRLIEEELSGPGEPNLADIRDWLASCVRAVNRGAGLTKSMLAFSRRQPLSPVVVDLNSVLDDSLEMLSRTLGESYQLEIVKSPSLWLTEVDVNLLRNSLLNLLLNARDAVPQGGKLIVKTRNVQVGADVAIDDLETITGDFVELSVTDFGTGMEPDVLKRVFEPFFTTKEASSGSGLGLSMVYGFVKQSGGNVEIESETGRGTTVRLLLPRRLQRPAAEPQPIVESTGASIEGETVVVVDDNDELRYLMRRQIERMGSLVFDAADAEGGLELLRAYPEAKLLVTDVVLPNAMSGVALAEQAMTEFPDLRVIFVSGYNEEHHAFDRIRGKMAIHLLQKPFQPDEFNAAVRSAFS